MPSGARSTRPNSRSNRRKKVATMLATTVAHIGGAGGGPGWWILFPIAWFLLFWGVIATVLVVGFRRRRAFFRPGRSGESVLAERYARGEVTEQEYRDRLAVLREPPGR
jgi:putative membrane protein